MAELDSSYEMPAPRESGIFPSVRRQRRKVYINGRFLSQRQTGVQRYALETLHELDALLADGHFYADLEICLLAPEDSPLPHLRAITARAVGPFQGHLWEQLTLPLAARDGLLWSFGPTGPLLTTNQGVTLHDATVRAVPESFSWKFRTWYELTLPVLVKRSRKLMTVSQFSRQELELHYGAHAKDVQVSGEGWQHATRLKPDNDILARHKLTPHKYVLAVSSVTPHKNFAVIERALAHLTDTDFRVVIAGDVNDTVFGSLPQSALQSLTLVGYVNDSELRALYDNAGVFVHPSLYEGFGLPPLEAMACGAPVIVSRAASMPEVCGDGALYFDPGNERELADLIKGVMSNEAERRALIERGQAVLKQHSWRAAALHHLEAIEVALGVRQSVSQVINVAELDVPPVTAKPLRARVG